MGRARRGEREYWEDVGVKTVLNPLGDVNFRHNDVEHIIIEHPYADTSEIGDILWAGRAAPHGMKEAPAWVTWLRANRDIETGTKTLADFEGGKLPGEEPPEHVKQQWERTLQKQRVPFGSKEYMAVMTAIYDYQAEHLYHIGTVGLVPVLYIANKDIGNVPSEMPPGSIFFGSALMNAQQLFWRR